MSSSRPKGQWKTVVGLSDLAAGDHVRVIGERAVMSHRCPASSFVGVVSVARVVFSIPPPPPPVCRTHRAPYIAEGTLVSQTLAGNVNGTFSGDVTVIVKHANRFGHQEKGTMVTYTLTDAKVAFRPKARHGVPVGLGDLIAGDHVKVVGKVTLLAPRCRPHGYVGAVTVTRVVFHVPQPVATTG